VLNGRGHVRDGFALNGDRHEGRRRAETASGALEPMANGLALFESHLDSIERVFEPQWSIRRRKLRLVSL
jgi:hypothetical protein